MSSSGAGAGVDTVYEAIIDAANGAATDRSAGSRRRGAARRELRRRDGREFLTSNGAATSLTVIVTFIPENGLHDCFTRT